MQVVAVVAPGFPRDSIQEFADLKGQEIVAWVEKSDAPPGQAFLVDPRTFRTEDLRTGTIEYPYLKYLPQ